MDKEGYPTKEELDRIESWPLDDIEGLYAFVKGLWAYPQYWREAQDYIFVSTCGLSGNELIIDALQENKAFWDLHLYSYKYGGHYTFLINAFKIPTPPNLRHERCELCIHYKEIMDGNLPRTYCGKYIQTVLELDVCDDYECGLGEDIS